MDLEQWQQDRIKFYTESKALDFINNYFKVKKGARCIVGHIKDMYKLRRQPTYRIYQDNKCRALTLPDTLTRKYNSLAEFWTAHSYMYTFDKRVLDWTDLSIKREIMKYSLEGINAVIEIDSPEEPDSEKAKRTNFFDYIPEFNAVINRLDKILTELGEDYNIQFSGNGIYIILEGYYEDNLQDYVDNFVNLLDNLREKENLGDLLKVHVDNKAAPWNDYFKIPFTFHEKRPRMSIPLQKGEIDKEWLDAVSNINSIMNDYNTTNNYKVIDEIIKKANWRKLW